MAAVAHRVPDFSLDAAGARRARSDAHAKNYSVLIGEICYWRSSPASLDPGGVTHAQPVTGHNGPFCGHGGWTIGAWQRLGDWHSVASSPASSAPESVTGIGPREGEQYHAV